MTRYLAWCGRGLAAALALTTGAAGITSAQVDPSMLAGMQARSIGPSGMSGRIAAIDAVEANPNIIYAGTATGGLWKSTTGGVTWSPLTDSLPASSIGAVAIFQASPDIVWIGTGERNRRNSAGVGTGVYKSMDGGRSWKLLGLDNTGAIDAIILHPSDPNTAYVGALGNTWTESEDRGVYRTTDGGKTWARILYVNERTGAGDLVMDPSNPNKLIAAMWEHRRWPWFFTSGGPGSGLHLSVDGGDTWKRLTSDDGLPDGELGRIGLDFARSNPNVVYAVVEAKRSVMLRSDDGGFTWRTVNRERGIAQRPFYYAQVRVDPENENRVYNVHGTIDLSEDGGKSFRVLLPFARVHVDHHAFWINPRDGRLLIDGNDGGIYISRDRGASWRFVENLPLAQFYHINVDMDTPFNVYGGLQDNGSWQGPSRVWENGGIRYYHWKEVGFGDGFATVIDANHPRYGYAMSQGGFLMRFDRETGERKSIRPAHPDGVQLRFNWNAGIAIDPFDGCVYYGSQFVHKTCDTGNSWEIISPDLTTNDPEKQKQLESGGLTYDVTAAENHTTILTIAPSPVERGVLWVGTDDGNVQVTRDSGATWENVVGRARNVPGNTWVPHIEPSKFDSGTAFVVFDDHRRGNNAPHVFRVTEYGRRWTSLVTDDVEPFNFVHVIEQDPVHPNVLYLGTEYGMYVSLNGGERWMLWWHGLPRAPTRALVVHPRDHDLVVGTHGRGAYVLDDVRSLRAMADDPAITEQPLHLFEIPPAIQYTVKQVDGMRFVADGMFIGRNRPYGALLTYWVREAPGQTAAAGAAEPRGGSGMQSEPDRGRGGQATIEVLDPSGQVIRTFGGPAKAGINRVAWNLRRDGFRRPSTAEDVPEEFLPPGPPVMAGTYAVRVKVGDHVSQEQSVEVRLDPRFEISMADREARLAMLMRAGQRGEVSTEAIERIRDARKAIDQVLDQVKADDDSAAQALTAAGRELKATLDSLEVRFLGPQDIQGILRRPDAVSSQLFQVYGALSSSWEAPTQSDSLYLQQAEAALSDALAEVNRVFAEDVAAFREQVEAMELELFPEKGALTLDWRREP